MRLFSYILSAVAAAPRRLARTARRAGAPPRFCRRGQVSKGKVIICSGHAAVVMRGRVLGRLGSDGAIAMSTFESGQGRRMV